MVVSKSKLAHIFIAFTLVLSFFFLRPVLIFLYPILTVLLFYLLRLKIQIKPLLFILFFLVIGLLSSFLSGGYYTNLFISLYLIVPVWIFLVSIAKKYPETDKTRFFDHFVKVLTWILIIVNVSAVIYSQFIVDTSSQNYEDAFTGLYGVSGFGSHTLSVMNLGFSVYFLNTKEYGKFTFFLLCGVMGFYGLGMLLFIASLSLLYIGSFLKYWRILGIILISGVVAFFFINTFNTSNLSYIKKNINQVLLVFDSYNYEDEMEKSKMMKITDIPRFITFLDGAKKRFFSDPKILILGSTPGGYNSRTAFYLNGDFVQNKFILNHFNIRSPYHKEDIFPLMNRELLNRPFNDGTRNQTFSSIVSLLLEYGIFAGGGYLFFFFRKIRRIGSIQKNKAGHDYINFLIIYLLLLISVQNYLEYPEIIFPFILLIKLAEVDQINNQFPGKIPS